MNYNKSFIINDIPGLFVTGTDTDVGKTFVASAIVRRATALGFRVGAIKPIATGCERRGDHFFSTDASELIQSLGREIEHSRVAPIVFERPLAPVTAARLEGVEFTLDTILKRTREAMDFWISESVDMMIIEGVGGLLCPIARRATVADLAIALDYPLIVVASRGLGTLHRTLSTVEAALSRGLRVAGIVLNSVDRRGDSVCERENGIELAEMLPGIAILAEIPRVDDGTDVPSPICAVDWYDRARRSRLSTVDSRGVVRERPETGEAVENHGV